MKLLNFIKNLFTYDYWWYRKEQKRILKEYKILLTQDELIDLDIKKNFWSKTHYCTSRATFRPSKICIEKEFIKEKIKEMLNGKF